MTPRWVSDIPAGGFEEAYHNALADAFEDMFGSALVSEAFAGTWQKRERSRAPYTDAWEIEGAGITFFASPSLNHCCCEISGAGCERLIALEALSRVLERAQERVTRVDIACDIETPVTPSQFVADLSHKRMRASGYQISETGETQYVGSQKSDRYARVYRYNPPHPRSHLLRIEHVFRREYAKVVAAACLTGSVQDIAASAGKAFGWASPIWDVVGAAHVDISVHGGDKSGNATLFWLVNSCAPAFKKLVKKGVLDDPEGFLARHFLSED